MLNTDTDIVRFTICEGCEIVSSTRRLYCRVIFDFYCERPLAGPPRRVGQLIVVRM